MAVAPSSWLLAALAALVLALTLSAAPPALAQTGVSVATLKVAGESAFTGLFAQLASSYLFSKDDVSLSYLAQNDSDDGLRLYSAGNADGALVAVPAATADEWPGMVYIPIACMPIVPIYRLPSTGSAQPLVLDCATLGGIWAGSVTRWRDPRVIALNSANEAMLPDADITLLVDSWASESSATGISGAFARSLSGCSDEFAQAWASSGRDWAQMPPVVGGRATSVADRVAGVIQRPADEGVLTYGIYSEATTAAASAAGVKIASMMPSSPAAVTPIGAAGVLTAATSAVGTALTAFANGSLTTVGPSSGVVTSRATTDWPLVSLLMLTIAANSSGRGLPVGTSAVGDCSYPRELLRMMAWVQVNERVDTMLTQQGFAPLPKTFRSHATDLVGTVSCGGTRILDQAALIAMGEPLVYVYQRMADSYTSGSFKVKFYSGNTDLVYNTMPTGQIDFGAVSNAVPPAIQAALPDMEALPMLAGALVPIYNVPELVGKAALIVDFATLTGIYINEIKYWDDDRLKQINPDIRDALPHVPIRIAYQSGSSAITYHYTNLLSKANVTFNATIGPGQTINFPVLQQEPNRTVPVNGMTVPISVSGASYSLAFWPRHSLEGVNNVLAAGMVNSAGRTVYAGTESIRSTLQDFSDRPVDSAFQMLLAPSAGSWPVAFFNVWLLRNTSMADCTKAQSLVEFLYWIQSSDTADAMAEFSYVVRVSHSSGAMARVLNTIKGMTCKGEPVSSLHSCIGDGTLCSNNGQCVSSKCVCAAPWAGDLCEINTQAANSGSNSDATTIALAVSLPAVFFVVVLALVLALVFLVLFRMREKPESWEVDLSEVELDGVLGQGGYGEVHKAMWKGTEVAVKMISSKNYSKDTERSFKEEVRVMTTLRHPNVVLFMAACTKPPDMAIIMEYMALGSLYDLLHNELIPDIPFLLKVKIGYQAAKGMHFLHSSGIVHRDLKSLNLLLDSKWNVKVSDFGLTKFKEEVKRNGASDAAGSIHWTAPEVLNDSIGLDFVLADVYSFGVIMWELLTRDQPYAGLSPAAIAVAVIRDDLRPKVPEDVPLEYGELMTACWHHDPTIRPTFLEIMTRLSSMVGDSSATNMTHTTSTGTSSSSSNMHHHGRHKHSKGIGSMDGSWTLPTSTNSSSSRSSSGNKSWSRGAPAAAGTAGVRAPEGEMVIVFTDIVRAASLWEFNAAAMRDATVAHNQLLRSLLPQHRGYEAMFIKDRNSGEGSFCMAFQNPVDAVEWCMAVQKDLIEVKWPEELIAHPGAAEEWGDTDDRVLYRGLRVRMGIHWGLPKCVRDPMTRRVEFVGPVVNGAARITALAHGGQILLSQALWASLKDSAIEQEKRIVALGKFELPDSPFGAKLYELKARGLEARFFGGVSRDAASEPSKGSHSGAGGDESLEHSGSGGSDDLQTMVGEGMMFQEDHYLTSANLCRWVIDYNEVQVGGQIGMGSYGVVYKGRWKGVEVAVKRFIKQKLDERRMLEFRAEMAFLSELHHPNIVLFIGACVKRPNLCIVTEFVKQGALKELLAKTSTIKLAWNQKLRLLHSAALGINYLHSLQPVIVHRDLKPSNLLVDESWNVKVADFGFARIKEENVTMTRCGSPCWTAPEVIKGDKYTESADVYSFGIIMWEVLTRRQPFAGRNFMGVSLDVLEGRRPQVPPDCPADFKKLMKRCWHGQADKRPRMDEVVETLAKWVGGTDSLISDVA